VTSASKNSCTPKGCERVAGGRSAAQTTGTGRKIISTLKGCQSGFGPRFCHPFRVRGLVLFYFTGGLRYASTTGYLLAALQAAGR